ncbi:hypothetical protein EJF36_07355 [Bacillus sp. HMF5848]|uniref:hypothetical protein n=1 Tax=Bacillus sp. HMF5848 TaxID=2495421 RepID=UPI000F7B04F6|nr:hypothetical protein [Bacillus sp. HMF5848]RSK26689.1 hypothetical protein EJF36_07355 [Bacillus sp. HMF5848]
MIILDFEAHKEAKEKLTEECARLWVSQEDTTFWFHFATCMYHYVGETITTNKQNIDDYKILENYHTKFLMLYQSHQDAEYAGVTLPLTYKHVFLLEKYFTIFLDICMEEGEHEYVEKCEYYLEYMNKRIQQEQTVFATIAKRLNRHIH